MELLKVFCQVWIAIGISRHFQSKYILASFFLRLSGLFPAAYSGKKPTCLWWIKCIELGNQGKSFQLCSSCSL